MKVFFSFIRIINAPVFFHSSMLECECHSMPRVNLYCKMLANRGLLGMLTCLNMKTMSSLLVIFVLTSSRLFCSKVCSCRNMMLFYLVLFKVLVQCDHFNLLFCPTDSLCHGALLWRCIPLANIWHCCLCLFHLTRFDLTFLLCKLGENKWQKCILVVAPQ